MKQHSGIIFSLSGIALAGFLVTPNFFNSTVAAQEKPSPPVVQVEMQPEMPLKIVITSIDSTDAKKPKIEYLLSNDGQRAIRAYTIRHEMTTAHYSAAAPGSTTSIAARSGSLLQPGQTVAGEMSSFGNSEPVTGVRLSVDVIEFDNGEFLGPDLTRSSERISGMHAGVKTAVSFFRQQREQSVSDEFAESLKTDVDRKIISQFPPEKSKSARWIRGYQSGIASVRARLVRARENGGIEEAEKELVLAIREAKEK